jgi:transposase
MTTLADRLLPDQLWQRIQPLLPPPPSRARGGAPRTVDDRACTAAIVFMAPTSTPWALLPVGEFGCGSVTTCWRRFAEWAHTGRSSGCTRCCSTSSARLASSTVPRQRGQLRPARGAGGPGGRKPARPGQARVQAAPGRRRWRAAVVAAGDRGQHQRQPGVCGAAGRPPQGAHADGSAALPAGQVPRRQGLRPSPLPGLPRPPRHQGADRPTGVESSVRLGRYRWKAERSIAWLAGCRRLRVRYDRDSGRF